MDKYTLALIMAGPYESVPEGSKFSLDHLRQVRWSRHLSSGERSTFIRQAECLLREFEISKKPPPQPDKPIRLIPFHQNVLKHLFEDDRAEVGSSFHNMAINLQADKNKVRLACRALKRKGLAKQVSFHDDEGHIRGSGYGITPAGIAYGEARGWKGADE